MHDSGLPHASNRTRRSHGPHSSRVASGYRWRGALTPPLLASSAKHQMRRRRNVRPMTFQYSAVRPVTMLPTRGQRRWYRRVKEIAMISGINLRGECNHTNFPQRWPASPAIRNRAAAPSGQMITTGNGFVQAIETLSMGGLVPTAPSNLSVRRSRSRCVRCPGQLRRQLA